MSYQSPTDINKQTYLSYTPHNLSAAAGLRQNAFPEFAQSDRPPLLLNCVSGWLFISTCHLENEQNHRESLVSFSLAQFSLGFFFFLLLTHTQVCF